MKSCGHKTGGHLFSLGPPCGWGVGVDAELFRKGASRWNAVVVCIYRITAAHIYTFMCVCAYICTHVNLHMCAQVLGG